MKPSSNLAQFDRLPEIQSLSVNLPRDLSMQFDCLRLDKVHPQISGNKWYKLKYHLEAARREGKSCLLSFGGAYSNHLHALAYAGRVLGFETIGVVRGEPPAKLSPTLQDCEQWGMKLQWLSRDLYRSSAEAHRSDEFMSRFPDAWCIPEGGEGALGVLGIQELFVKLGELPTFDYDYIVCPVGSGTTLSGVAAANMSAQCIGFSALKGAVDLEQRIENQLEDFDACGRWQVCHEYHFGGYAKINTRLSEFISKVYDQQGVLLDPVYTSKMMFGLMEWAIQGRIRPTDRILVVHTGGLQGWRGFGSQGPTVWHNK